MSGLSEAAECVTCLQQGATDNGNLLFGEVAPLYDEVEQFAPAA